MAYLFVDGDYLLSGMTPTCDSVVRETVEHLLNAVETKLLTGSSSGTVELRIAFFSSSMLQFIGEEDRGILLSSLRRLRFQTIVLDCITDRPGSPIDAAMCTRTMTLFTNPGAKKHALVYFTSNAYISSALEWAQGAGSAISFAVYEGDTVSDVLFAYASGSGAAAVPKGPGVPFAPGAAAEAPGLPLAHLQRLRAARQRAPGAEGAPPVFAPPPAIAGGRSPFEEGPAAGEAQGGEETERDIAATEENNKKETATEAIKETTAESVKETTAESIKEPKAESTKSQETSVATTTGPAAPDGLPEPAVAARLPVGWGLMYDRQRRRHYFVHAETGRTTWTHPGGAAEQLELERQVKEWYTKQQELQQQSENSVAPAAKIPGAVAESAEEWDECIDAKSGKKYYVNRQSKQTSWTRPNSNTQPTSNPIASSMPIKNLDNSTVSQVRGSSVILPQWEERVDANSGRKFYVNHQTRETTWTPPPVTQTAEPTPVSSSVAEGLPPHWEERMEESTGRKFYVNHQTRETTWTRPGSAFQTPVSKPSPLPPGWEAQVDQRTGRLFYVNHQTRQTTWTSPSS